MSKFIYQQSRPAVDGQKREAGRTTQCKHANTGLPHNPECSRGWVRASQTVPYAEHPFDNCGDDCFECVKQAAWWQQEAIFKAEERAR